MRKTILLLGVGLLLLAGKASAQLGITFNGQMIIGPGEAVLGTDVQITPSGSVSLYGCLASKSVLAIQSGGGKLFVYPSGMAVARTLNIPLGGILKIDLGGQLRITPVRSESDESETIGGSDCEVAGVGAVLDAVRLRDTQDAAIRIEFSAPTPTAVPAH
jgi:hypothetical protein